MKVKVRLNTNLGDMDRIALGLESEKGLHGDWVQVKKEDADMMFKRGWAMNTEDGEAEDKRLAAEEKKLADEKKAVEAPKTK